MTDKKKAAPVKKKVLDKKGEENKITKEEFEANLAKFLAPKKSPNKQ